MKHKQVAVRIKAIAEHYGMENQLSKTLEERLLKTHILYVKIAVQIGKLVISLILKR